MTQWPKILLTIKITLLVIVTHPFIVTHPLHAEENIRIAAETVSIPVSQQGQHIANIKKPQKGSNRQSVLKQFGNPLKRTTPVGDPPIERWDYPHFSVYFEYNHVIHSVLKHRKRMK